MQLARRLQQARHDQDRRHHRPVNLFPARGDQLREQGIEAQSAPQGPARPHIAELPAALQTDPVQPYRDGFRRFVFFEEPDLSPAAASNLFGQSARLRASQGIELSQRCDRLLPDARSDTHAPYQTPIHVPLAVLADRGVSQVHSALLSRAVMPAEPGENKGVGWHYIGVRQKPRCNERPCPAAPRKKTGGWVRTGEVGLTSQLVLGLPGRVVRRPGRGLRLAFE